MDSRTTIDLGIYIVSYNLVIGVLLILASSKIASLATILPVRVQPTIERYTRIAVNTFGSSVAVLSATVLIAFHLLRLGVD